MSNIPTLALIPSAYKTSKVYSVLPSNGDGDFSFTRNSGATRVNKDGLIETVASGVPRLDYSDGSCPSLLLEPQSTNLITYSEDFSQSDWAKQSSGVGSAPVVTSNYAISPDGTLNADRVVFDINGGTTSSDFSQIADSVTNSIGDVTNSVWIKSNTGSNYNMSLISPTAVYTSIVVTTEWQRFDITSTTVSTASALRLRLRGGEGTSDYADVSVWGAQVEQGSYPTSYIPTSGSTVTRNADFCNSAGNSNVFNDSEGVIYTELSKDGINPTNYSGLSLSNGGLSERIQVRYAPNSNTIQLVVRVGGSAVVVLSHTITNIENKHKIAVQFKKDDFAFWVNGTKVGTDTSGDVPSGLNEFAFDDGSGANVFTGNVYNIRVYNNLLSDIELTELTTL